VKKRYTLRATGMGVLTQPTRCGCVPRPEHRAFSWQATIVTNGTVNGIAFMAENVKTIVDRVASFTRAETCEEIADAMALALLDESGLVCRSVTVVLSPYGCDGRSIEAEISK